MGGTRPFSAVSWWTASERHKDLSPLKNDKEAGLGMEEQPVGPLSVIIATWGEDLRADRSPRTIMRYQGILHRFAAWYLADTGMELSLRDLNPIVLVG